MARRKQNSNLFIIIVIASLFYAFFLGIAVDSEIKSDESKEDKTMNILNLIMISILLISYGIAGSSMRSRNFLSNDLFLGI